MKSATRLSSRLFGGLVIAAGLVAATSADNEAAATRAAAKAARGQVVWRVRPLSALPAMDSAPAFQVDFQPVASAPRLKKYQSTGCKPAQNGPWTCSPAVDRWLLAPAPNEGGACSAELDLARAAVPDETLLDVVDFVQSSAELRDRLARQRCSTAALCRVVAVSARPNGGLAITLSLPDACFQEIVLQRNGSGSARRYDLVECRTLCA